MAQHRLPPPCVHDGARFNQVVATTIDTRCGQCHAILYTTDKTGVAIVDDVYRQLYTPEGQAELLREALEARGWPYPVTWGHPVTLANRMPEPCVEVVTVVEGWIP